MDTFRILWRKDWLQHRAVLLVTAALCGSLFVLQLLGQAASGQVLSQLEAARAFMFFNLPLAALVLGHRLVVREYYGHTQRFIESLPVRPGTLELTKLIFGWVYLSVLAMAALSVAMLLAWRVEPLGGRFVAILTARSLGFVWAVWCVVVMMGLLGRLRVPLYVALGGGLFVLDRTTELELFRVGPLELIDPHTFAFERVTVPWQALVTALLVGAVALAVSLMLARLREGSLVETLAQPMSQREKSFAFLLVVGLLGALVFAGPDALAEPFRFDTEQVVRDGPQRVEVMYWYDEERDQARAWAQRWARARRDLRRALGWQGEQPWLRLGLDPSQQNEVDSVRVDRASGVVLGAHYLEDGHRDPPAITALMIHQLITMQSGDRTMVEPKHWVLDGFARWWAERYHDTSTLAPMVHGMRVAEDEEVSLADITDWSRLSERVGDPGSAALAYVLLRALEDMQGRGAVLRLARAVLTEKRKTGLRGWWHDRVEPMSVVFSETTGLSYERFIPRYWQWHRAKQRDPQVAALLAKGPRGTVAISAPSAPEGVTVLAQLDAPAVEEMVCAVKHLDLPPYDAAVVPADLRKIEQLWPRGHMTRETRLRGMYGQGERVFVAFDCWPPSLRAPLRLAVARLTIP